jgi:hypothetical protein
MRKSSRPNNLLLLSLGVAAGAVAGALLADRFGGLERLVKRGRASLRNGGKDGGEEETLELPYGLHDADGGYEDADEDHDELEHEHDEDDEHDDDLSPESVAHLHVGETRAAGRKVRSGASAAQRASAPDVLTLEARVLEAFHHDPVLRERAIDIGAIATGVIELTGWVHSDAEVEHAITIARGVPDVFHVVDQLTVRKPARARRATDARPPADPLNAASPPRAD